MSPELRHPRNVGASACVRNTQSGLVAGYMHDKSRVSSTETSSDVALGFEAQSSKSKQKETTNKHAHNNKNLLVSNIVKHNIF